MLCIVNTCKIPLQRYALCTNLQAIMFQQRSFFPKDIFRNQPAKYTSTVKNEPPLQHIPDKDIIIATIQQNKTIAVVYDIEQNTYQL